MKNLGKFSIILILTTVSAVLSGYVFIYLYEWFIIPTFQTPKISIMYSLGIMLLINYLLSEKSDNMIFDLMLNSTIATDEDDEDIEDEIDDDNEEESEKSEIINSKNYVLIRTKIIEDILYKLVVLVIGYIYFFIG